MTETMLDALRIQQVACASLGSKLYGHLLEHMTSDWKAGGVIAELLPATWERPVHDAVPLRLLAGVHRLVLAGEAPRLARFYPSAGGTDTDDPWPAFDAVARSRQRDLTVAVREQVQTNEVGRAAVLAGAFVEIGRRFGLPLALIEVGASGGLNLRWDRYAYDTGREIGGDRSSQVRFAGVWEGPPPALTPAVAVVERRGCDIAPIDAASPDGARRLESFVWPDQLGRLERLRAALAIAAAVPVAVDARDAGGWVADQLTVPRPGTTTVVFHSVVWQYLSPRSRQQLRAALLSAGSGATPEAPVAWLRMEPAGPHADLRLTSWPDGNEEVLAECGYHGSPIRWLA